MDFHHTNGVEFFSLAPLKRRLLLQLIDSLRKNSALMVQLRNIPWLFNIRKSATDMGLRSVFFFFHQQHEQQTSLGMM